MIEALEIAVLAVENFRLPDFFGDLSFNALPETGGIEYAVLPLTEQQHIYFYLLENFTADRDFNSFDRLIPKAAFSWLLYERRDWAFETMLKTYQSRYSTPLFCIAPKPLDESLSQVEEPFLQTTVLYYDSQSADHLRQVVRSSLVKTMELAEKGELFF